jgi:hypothetical protein
MCLKVNENFSEKLNLSMFGPENGGSKFLRNGIHLQLHSVEQKRRSPEAFLPSCGPHISHSYIKIFECWKTLKGLLTSIIIWISLICILQIMSKSINIFEQFQQRTNKVNQSKCCMEFPAHQLPSRAFSPAMNQLLRLHMIDIRKW